MQILVISFEAVSARFFAIPQRIILMNVDTHSVQERIFAPTPNVLFFIMVTLAVHLVSPLLIFAAFPPIEVSI